MSAPPPFRSDNTAGACPEVLEAIAEANRGLASAYGNDDLSAVLNEAMSDVFEHRSRCFPVGNGTSANALALSGLCEAGDVIACHMHAHILLNEDSAAQFFTGDVRMKPLFGDAGRIDAEALETFARVAKSRSEGRWTALSLTQLTEAGTVYSLEETAMLAGIARRGGAKVHMDGARFANAVASLRATPADLSWKRGVDVLSFGATKNGAMNVDAIVTFDAALAARIEARLKMSGQLYSKMRFMAAQLLALLKGGVWLRNARHANGMAEQLRERLSAVRGVEILSPVEGNHVFVKLDPDLFDRLEKASSAPWQSGTDDGGRPIYRLVTSYATTTTEIESFAAAFPA